MNKRGRPKREESMNNVVKVRLDDWTHGNLERIAKDSGLTKAEVVRKSIELMQKLVENGYSL